MRVSEAEYAALLRRPLLPQVVPGALSVPHVLVLPLRLVSESNQREHWTVKHRRTQEQRFAVYAALRCQRWRVPPLPVTITLTRIAPRLLDDDNGVGCFKAVQDGVADWLAGAAGRGQDRQPGLTWAYAQRQGKPREYALEIRLEGVPHASCPDDHVCR